MSRIALNPSDNPHRCLNTGDGTEFGDNLQSIVNNLNTMLVDLYANSTGPNSAIATADNGTSQTLTAAMMTGASEVYHTSAGGTTPSLQFPTAATIIAAVPGWVIGRSYTLTVLNTNSGTATMTTNTGLTLTGTMTLATATSRNFVVTMTGAATVTITNAGSGTV